MLIFLQVKKIKIRLLVKRGSQDKHREAQLQKRRQSLLEEKEKKVHHFFLLLACSLVPCPVPGTSLFPASVFPLFQSFRVLSPCIPRFCFLEKIGSLSKDDGYGSENVTIKMNSRLFKRGRDYSILL